MNKIMTDCSKRVLSYTLGCSCELQLLFKSKRSIALGKAIITLSQLFSRRYCVAVPSWLDSIGCLIVQFEPFEEAADFYFNVANQQGCVLASGWGPLYQHHSSLCTKWPIIGRRGSRPCHRFARPFVAPRPSCCFPRSC